MFLTFIKISGIILLVGLILAWIGAYHDWKDSEDYKVSDDEK